MKKKINKKNNNKYYNIKMIKFIIKLIKLIIKNNIKII